jgi:hypothetical protein
MKIKIKSTKGYANKLPNFPYTEAQRYTNAPEKLSMDEYNSLDTSDVKTTIPEAPEEIANVEAENGETVLKPDLSFYKIGGKSHARGGTNLLLEPGSFIFSNRIKVRGRDVKQHFNWVNPKKKYSIADLTKKYSDLNKYLEILESPDSDRYDKETALLMVEKYAEKLGTAATIQEGEKGFPEGLPQMANGGFVKYPWGGPFDPTSYPFPPDKTGKWAGDRKKSRNPKTGQASNTWNAMTKYSSPEVYAKAVGYQGNPQNIKAMQQWIMQEYPDLVNEIHSSSEYGQPAAGRPDDGKLGVRWEAIANRIPQRTPQPSMPNSGRPTIDTSKIKMPGGPNVEAKATEAPVTGVTDDSAPMISRQDWMYTIAPAVANWAGITKEYPRRYQNYGLQQAMGISANSKPVDFTSRITEVKKAARDAYDQNNASARPANISSAANAAIFAGAAGQSNAIKGDEYNTNVARYDQQQQQIANLAAQIGQDQMVNAKVYNDEVAALNQNFYEDKTRARNIAVGSFGQAESNALGLYAMNKFNPNYKINPWNLTMGFVPGTNPFNMAGRGGSGAPDPFRVIQEIKERIKKANPTMDDAQAYNAAVATVRQRPGNYQDDIYPNRVYPNE